MARKYSKKAAAKVGRAMKKRKAGTLKSGRSGRTVKSRKQAIAIGLSEARAAGQKVPKKTRQEDREEAQDREVARSPARTECGLAGNSSFHRRLHLVAMSARTRAGLAARSGMMIGPGKPQPAFLRRAAGRCAFLAARGPERRAGTGRFAEARPFRLCFSASIRLMTLPPRCSASAVLTGLPAALRLTSVFSAVSYSSLNLAGSKCAALVSRMWLARSTMSWRSLDS